MQNYGYSMETPVIEPPQRVVSLVPSVTESLFDLDLGRRVIAVTEACDRPADGVRDLPRIGPPDSVSRDQIIDLQPDLVIASQDVSQAQDIEALHGAGIPVWVTAPRSVLDAINLLWNMMHVFDHPVMVPRVRLIEQTMDWVQGISKAQEEHWPRVFVAVGYDPLTTFAAETYSHDLLRVCGGMNVFAEHVEGRYPVVTLDAVVAMQPDVVLLPSQPSVTADQQRAVFAALDIPAARAGTVHLVDAALLTWPGTRLAYALSELPKLLLPV